jgi:hypothetical protein
MVSAPPVLRPVMMWTSFSGGRMTGEGNRRFLAVGMNSQSQCRPFYTMPPVGRVWRKADALTER